MDQPTAEDAVRRLEPLVGEWTLEASPPEGPPWPGDARLYRVARLRRPPGRALHGRHARSSGRHLHHGLRRGEQHLHPTSLRRARHLPHLPDEHQRGRVEALARGRTVSATTRAPRLWLGRRRVGHRKRNVVRPTLLANTCSRDHVSRLRRPSSGSGTGRSCGTAGVSRQQSSFDDTTSLCSIHRRTPRTDLRITCSSIAR